MRKRNIDKVFYELLERKARDLCVSLGYSYEDITKFSDAQRVIYERLWFKAQLHGVIQGFSFESFIMCCPMRYSENIVQKLIDLLIPL